MEKPKTEKINLTDIISETIRSLKIPESVRVILNLPDEPLFVDIEAEQIRIALKNVIRNAVQAMNESGMLTIITQPKEEGFVEMTLTDNGPGILPEHINKVFEPLFSTKTHGIGFGLSITKMIIDNHGGTIRAESEPGKGVSFILRLPIYVR